MTPSIHLRVSKRDFENWISYLETLKYRLNRVEADIGTTKKIDYFFYEPSGDLSINVAASEWVEINSSGRKKVTRFMTVRLPSVDGPSKYSTQSGSLVFDPEATKLYG